MDWSFITDELTMPILGGPLAGKRWFMISRRSFLRGTYELEQVEAFAEAIQPGDVVYDIGAHWGYYAILASDRVGPTGQVFAFEPAPHNLAKLRKLLAINGCANTRMTTVAVAGENGTARFDAEGGSRTPRIAEDGTFEVQTITLDTLVNREILPPPDVIKIDIEGAEVPLLHAATHTLETVRPTLFLSTHKYAGTKEPCQEFLTQQGYSFEPLNGKSVEEATDFLCRKD